MFNISKELIIVAVVVMLIFGPKQIPKLAKMIGGSMKSVRDGIEGKVEGDDETAAPKAAVTAEANAEDPAEELARLKAENARLAAAAK
jgi:sec-independent protein translocase protein TatA